MPYAYITNLLFTCFFLTSIVLQQIAHGHASNHGDYYRAGDKENSDEKHQPVRT